MDVTQDTEKPRYKQLSEPPKPKHQHEYDIVVSETIVVRFCPECGLAWKIERFGESYGFTDEWKPIRETLG